MCGGTLDPRGSRCKKRKRPLRFRPVAAIRLDRLTKVYGDGTRAVHELDLEVAGGEFVVFVGPSGCGKTSALRMIAGLEEISGRTLRVGGEGVNALSPKNRAIAVGFQNSAP